MNTDAITRFLEAMDALPAPVQAHLPAGERQARDHLDKRLRQGVEAAILNALAAYLDLLHGLPAPLLVQLPSRTAMESLLEC